MKKLKSTKKGKRRLLHRKGRTHSNSNQWPADADEAIPLLDIAAQHSSRGNLVQAEQIYRQVLENDPHNIAALNAFGVLRRIQGRLEEAVSLFRKALRIDSDTPAVHRNLGNAHYDLRQFNPACHHLKLALAANPGNLLLAVRLCDASIYSDNDEEALYAAGVLLEQAPESPAAHNRLGCVLMHCRRLDEAGAAFNESLRLDPGNAGTRHMIEVLAGGQPAKPDPGVIRGNYNNVAAEYDKTIVHQLKNRTPQLLRGLLDRLTRPMPDFSLALDLACGTGLMGVQIRPLVRTLVGVDISSEMVGLARRKNIYDQLKVEDLVTYITGNTTDYDLFCCSDALIHLGDLESLLDAVSGHSSPGALFLFSTELTDTGAYRLDPSSYRYRHNPGYVKKLLPKFRLELIDHEVADIRVDRGDAVPGGLYLAEKRRE